MKMILKNLGNKKRIGIKLLDDNLENGEFSTMRMKDGNGIDGGMINENLLVILKNKYGDLTEILYME